MSFNARILLAWLICATSTAAEIRLGPGTWYGTQSVTIVVAVDGSRIVTGSTITITGGGVTGPVDTPPGTPPGTPLEKHRVAVHAATAVISDPNAANTKTALAKLYTTVAGLPVTDRSQLAQATDVLFGAMGLPPPWTAWKSAVDLSLAKFTGLAEAKAAWLATGEEVGR
jgi:hypothetical protein